MRIVCWQTILVKYHTLFFSKIGKDVANLSSAAVVIGALRVNVSVSTASLHFVLEQGTLTDPPHIT